MTEQFIGEIRIFGGDYAPKDWAFCDGQLLPIAQNTQLFEVIGTTYGGDGKTTMALPNMQGRAPMHAGHGPGLAHRRVGETLGQDTVTLTESQMPSHHHPVSASSANSEGNSPPDNTKSLARSGLGDSLYQSDSSKNLVGMADNAIGKTGGGQAHDNMQPYLSINFIIALKGIDPRSVF